MRGGVGSILALTCALACGACSAPATCDAQQSSYDSPLVQSEEKTGTIVLSDKNERKTLHFIGTLSDLPELWSSQGLMQAGGLALELSLRYENEPFGGDGKTEMPRLAVTFNEPVVVDSSTTTTGSYPNQPYLYSPSLFDDCAFGAQRCESTRGINIERLDGAPYPPLRVSWRASATARIPTCDALTSKTRATLEVEVEAQ